MLFLLERIDEEFGPGIATPDHVVTVAGEAAPCPATEPQEVYDPVPYPPVCPGGGDRVRIYVADTGVLPGTVARTPWLTGVSGDDDPRIAGNGTIKHYGGHGTFVAGVIRSQAPDADIVVKNVFNIAGSQLESVFVPDLYAGFGYGADIFHLTVAAPTRCNFPLLAFEAWLEDLRQHKGVVCVVAAGNSGEQGAAVLAGRVPGSDLGRGARDRLAQPCVLQQFRRLGRRVRSRPEPRQRFCHWPVHLPGRTLCGGGKTLLRHGAVERDFFLDPDRDRTYRGPDGSLRGER